MTLVHYLSHKVSKLFPQDITFNAFYPIIIYCQQLALRYGYQCRSHMYTIMWCCSSLPHYDSVNRIIRSSAVKAHRHQQWITARVFANVVLMLLHGRHIAIAMHAFILLNYIQYIYIRRLQTLFLKYRANWNGVTSVDTEICSVAMSWADQWPDRSQADSYPSPSSQNPLSMGESTTMGNRGGMSGKWADSLALARTCKSCYVCTLHKLQHKCSNDKLSAAL